MGKHADRFFRCWSCRARFESAAVRRDGILHSRHDRFGGPFYRYTCPACHRENLCEATTRGTFFASPPASPTLVEWLLGLFAARTAEEFLRSAAWLAREGERRRYVFERDADFRYSSLRERIAWYVRRADIEPPLEAEDLAQPPPPPVPSPYAILGLPATATRDEVKRAFLRLVRRHHPDKVHHLGPEVVRLAEERFKELMAAYERLAGR